MAPKKAAKKKAKAAKHPKAGKREKFPGVVNTKTGAKGDAAVGKEAPFVSTSRMTPGSTLKSLLTECRGFKKNVDSIVGSMRERIAYAKDKKNLHTGVFGWLRKIDNMEAEKAAEWHATYIHYLETSGLMAKIDSAQRLPMGDAPAVEGEEPDDDGEDAPHTDSDVSQSTAGNGAGDGAGEAAEASETGGIKPAANVTRPRFGQRPPAGISGDDLAKATGTDVKH